MPCRGCGKNSGRAVGEIGEALPVADEASRFRGSAPIGGHDSDRESVGTTVGNRRPLRKRILWCVGEGLCPSRGRGRTPPLRKCYKRCGAVRNPPVTALPCQPPLGKGAEETGDADCHSQFANWPRNDTFSRSAVGFFVVRRGGALPLPRATARVAPTEGYKRCGEVKNPPVTASPCQPPLGKGAEGTGGRIATASVRTGFAMTWFFTWSAVQGRAGGQGRPPLRKRYKGCNGRATARVAPTEGYKRVRYGGPM